MYYVHVGLQHFLQLFEKYVILKLIFMHQGKFVIKIDITYLHLLMIIFMKSKWDS